MLAFHDFIENKYIYIGEFHEGLAPVKNKENLWGYIDKQGNEVIPCKYSNVGDFSEGYAAVQDKKWGYIDKEGNLKIPFKFEGAEEFHNGLAFVKFREQDLFAPYCFFIDKEGNQAIDHWYESTTNFKEGYAVVAKKQGYIGYDLIRSIIDKEGNELVTDKCISRDNDLAFVSDCLNYCYIYDIKNKKIFDKKKRPIDTPFVNFKNGMILIKPKGKYGFLDINLKKVIPCMYEEATSFVEDVSVVKFDDDTIGFIDKKGKSVLFSKEKYQEIYNFSEGLAGVRNPNGLYGYINKSGEEVIACIYTAADDFSEGLAGVIDQDNNLFYIDKQGTKVLEIPKIYNSILDLGDRKIPISAQSQEELNEKKLELLKNVKEELINDITTNIDNLTNEIIKVKK